MDCLGKNWDHPVWVFEIPMSSVEESNTDRMVLAIVTEGLPDISRHGASDRPKGSTRGFRLLAEFGGEWTFDAQPHAG